jgi:hypothetical protein
METVLLEAHCATGHEWDVWGETRGNGAAHVPPSDLRCPTCEPDAYAIAVSERESLA